jgi:aryl-alcohol dehydrogenase-like predicted oxidoreductase
VDAYLQLAREYELDPSQMALAWAMQRSFMGSVIFGAKNLQQLEIALGAQDLKLPDEVIKGIDAIQRVHPMPF